MVAGARIDQKFAHEVETVWCEVLISGEDFDDLFTRDLPGVGRHELAVVHAVDVTLGKEVALDKEHKTGEYQSNNT